MFDMSPSIHKEKKFLHCSFLNFFFRHWKWPETVHYVLQDIGKGAFVREQYIGHLMLTANNRSAFIATDK